MYHIYFYYIFINNKVFKNIYEKYYNLHNDNVPFIYYSMISTIFNTVIFIYLY